MSYGCQMVAPLVAPVGLGVVDSAVWYWIMLGSAGWYWVVLVPVAPRPLRDDAACSMPSVSLTVRRFLSSVGMAEWYRSHSSD